MRRKVTFASKVPQCFSSLEQYKAWKECARMSYAPNHVCTDCTPEYQERMKDEGRCENPQVQFEEDEDGFIFGVVYLTLFKGNEDERPAQSKKAAMVAPNATPAIAPSRGDQLFIPTLFD